MRHEYFMHFDPDLKHWNGHVDYIIRAGRVIHIGMRCDPLTPMFFILCKRIFSRNDLRSFIRTQLDEKTHQIITVAAKLPETEGKELRRCYRTIITSVRLIDKVTKEVKIVELGNSDAFTAQEVCLRELYGENYEISKPRIKIVLGEER
jgi:hypothetical protein